MLYQIAYKKSYEDVQVITPGQTYTEKVDVQLDKRYNYKLRLRGGVGIPYTHRTETDYPIYFRKIEDSLLPSGNTYTLEFNDDNLCYKRTVYTRITDNLKTGVPYEFTLKAKANGIKDNFKVYIDAFYGAKRTRYYREQADLSTVIDIKDSADYVEYKKRLTFEKEVDFVMIKICSLGFEGNASIFAPTFIEGGKNYIADFEFAPKKLREQQWIGEGFSLTERPSFTVKCNGKQIFSGKKTDRLQRLTGVEFVIDTDLLTKNNVFEIKYDEVNKIQYEFEELQLIALPKETEILGVQSNQVKGVPFGAICYFDKDCDITVESDGIKYLGENKVNKGYKVLRFVAEKAGRTQIKISDGTAIRTCDILVSAKQKDDVITGSGDFIYINQNFEDFIEYIAWYVREDIGDMITLRSCYRWGGTSEADPEFWAKAVEILKDLGLYYALMIDGRELNGINANPTFEMLDSEYFLGEQTHEKDGSYTYWIQDLDDYEDFFNHLITRKMHRNGITGKFSPVYDKQGNSRWFYAGDNIENVKDAYEELVRNLKNTAIDGATRHTGVTPLFSAFFDAGYKWLGYESMYGSHEIIFGALRGMSNSKGIDCFGSHLALQWSTAPCDVMGHALRYRLALYSSYMNGVKQINTEEGLWNIENPFEGFDRFSYACTIHREEQKKFNRFIKTHTRRGKQSRRIAMMVGKYDGMDCFSTGSVYGQKGKYWLYNTPEDSWDLLKVFYPQAKVGQIYHFVQKGGEKGLRPKDVEFLKAWPHLYGEKALEEQSLGFYSGTPYGMIDLISWDATNLDDYDFIFITGWNTCCEEQLENLCGYMEKGGKVMLAKPHLYDTVSREEALTKNASVIKSALVDKLLSYVDKGNLIYFDKDAYPIEFATEYADELKKAGKEFGTKFVDDVDHVCFTEYKQDNGSTALYMVNIRWWEETPATCTLKLGEDKYALKFTDNYLKLMAISPNGKKAVLVSGDVDAYFVDDNTVILSGEEKADITVFANGQEKTEQVEVLGEYKLTV